MCTVVSKPLISSLLAQHVSFCLQSVNPQYLSTFLVIFLLLLDFLETERPVIRPHIYTVNTVYSGRERDRERSLRWDSNLQCIQNTFTPNIMWYKKSGISFILRVPHCYANNNFDTFYKCRLAFSHSHFQSICCCTMSLYLWKTLMCFFYTPIVVHGSMLYFPELLLLSFADTGKTTCLWMLFRYAMTRWIGLPRLQQKMEIYF